MQDARHLGQQLMVRTFAADPLYRVSLFKLVKDLRRQTIYAGFMKRCA
jgi:hypothetical protein